MNQREKLMGVLETSQVLGGLHPNTVYKMAKHGVIPFIKIGRLVKFRESEILDWIKKQARTDISEKGE